ncbi:MAG: homoserine dehydrogenase, partial [Candidatus Polarisedimenticolia bacterium]
MRVGFAGFGNVGTALARLILERRGELRRRHDLEIDVTLLASARRGALVEPAGLDLARALDAGWS